MALVNDAINEVNYVVNANSLSNLSSPENYALDQEGGVSASSSSPVNSDHQGFVFYPSDQTADNSLMHFKDAYDHHFAHSNGSFLNFEKIDQPVMSGDYSVMSEGNLNNGYNGWNQINNTNPRLLGHLNCFETSSGFGNIIASNSSGKDWLYCDATVVTTGAMQESVSSDSASSHKRPVTGEISMQAPKKQCSGSTGKSKPKTTASSKDPQSTAAKVRRERISERLKILQELVPNGTKVDLVTMLEKAISYVKFLQLQVKVLATDEFWPAQGGKVPDISQVKDAIDAILSSQRDNASQSKN